MADPRFFRNHGPFSLRELAELGGALLASSSDGDRQVNDIAPLDLAGPDDLSFFENRAYLSVFRRSRAGACVVSEKDAEKAPDGMMLLVTDTPYQAYARMAQAFYPVREAPKGGVSPQASVDDSARMGESTAVGPGTVIGERVEIGARCRIGANVTIDDGVVIGDDCIVKAGVNLSHCLIGDRVTIHPGVCIGQDGFGFATDPQRHIKVPQVGRVLIGNDCEIGANCTIDRGANRDTVVGDNCWIDNLVQIGHNVEIGNGCIIVAMAGISGSTKVGDYVAIGGQAGLAGHLTIGSGAQIAAQAGVMSDVPAGAVMAGSPAMPIKEHFRQVASLKRLARQRGREA